MENKQENQKQGEDIVFVLGVLGRMMIADYELKKRREEITQELINLSKTRPYDPKLEFRLWADLGEGTWSPYFGGDKKTRNTIEEIVYTNWINQELEKAIQIMRDIINNSSNNSRYLHLQQIKEDHENYARASWPFPSNSDFIISLMNNTKYLARKIGCKTKNLKNQFKRINKVRAIRDLEKLDYQFDPAKERSLIGRFYRLITKKETWKRIYDDLRIELYKSN